MGPLDDFSIFFPSASRSCNLIVTMGASWMLAGALSSGERKQLVDFYTGVRCFGSHSPEDIGWQRTKTLAPAGFPGQKWLEHRANAGD